MTDRPRPNDYEGNLYTFIDEPSDRKVIVAGNGGRLPFRPDPKAVFVEVEGCLYSLDEMTAECPCCGTDVEVDR